MQRLARFIVDKRWFFAAIFVALIGYSIFGITRIRVEYDITKYLPANTDTAKAIEIMEKEFEIGRAHV